MELGTTIRLLFNEHTLCKRVSWIWSIVFSTAAILCSISILSPRCPLALPAWEEFVRLVNIMEEIESTCKIVAVMMVLQRERTVRDAR